MRSGRVSRDISVGSVESAESAENKQSAYAAPISTCGARHVVLQQMTALVGYKFERSTKHLAAFYHPRP